MKEIKEIKDYPGYYIDKNGNVFSTKYGKFKQLKTSGKEGSYIVVGLCRGGKQIMNYVHRLIAEAFIPNPEGKPQVNHKDGNKSNNAIENLEWVTSKENIQHAYHILCVTNSPKWQERKKRYEMKKEKAKAEIKAKKLRNMVKCVETEEEFKNQSEAAKKFGVTRSYINLAIKKYLAVQGKYHFVHTILRNGEGHEPIEESHSETFTFTFHFNKKN